MAPFHDEEDDDFPEYNPHPYQGGYDIALTYGQPLPPSPSTCYPIQYSNNHHPPPLDSGDSTHHPPPFDSSDSTHHPPPLDSGDSTHTPVESSNLLPVVDANGSGYLPVDYSPSFDLFGFWPSFLNPADVEDVGYWGRWRRAGDYLFGYSEGYGERRIGVDSYGIPIYANKKEASQALTFEIQPAREGKLDYCYFEGDSRSSFYDEKKDEIYGYNHSNHYYYKDPNYVQEVMVEPLQHQQLTYYEGYEENVYRDQEISYSEYVDGSNFFGNSQCAYERHSCEEPLRIELEPHKPTWSELEPYTPSWSQNLSYREFYSGAASLESNWDSSADNIIGDDRSIFANSNCAYGSHCYEHPPCDQMDPFISSWSQIPTSYEPCMQELSEPNWVDKSFEEYGAQYFNPFTNYSEYHV